MFHVCIYCTVTVIQLRCIETNAYVIAHERHVRRRQSIRPKKVGVNVVHRPHTRIAVASVDTRPVRRPDEHRLYDVRQMRGPPRPIEHHLIVVAFCLRAARIVLRSRLLHLQQRSELVAMIPAIPTTRPHAIAAIASTASAAAVRHADGTRVGRPRAPHAVRRKNMRVHHKPSSKLVEKVRRPSIDDRSGEAIVVSAVECDARLPDVVARAGTVDQIESV